MNERFRRYQIPLPAALTARSMIYLGAIATGGVVTKLFAPQLLDGATSNAA